MSRAPGEALRDYLEETLMFLDFSRGEERPLLVLAVDGWNEEELNALLLERNIYVNPPSRQMQARGRAKLNRFGENFAMQNLSRGGRHHPLSLAYLSTSGTPTPAPSAQEEGARSTGGRPGPGDSDG